MSDTTALLNEQAEKVEDALNRAGVVSPCVICPDSGCIALDFSDCSDFEVLVTEDITCMRVFGEGAPGNIDFVIPPNATRFITGFPSEWFPEGNEGSVGLNGGTNGRTYGFKHNGNVGGGVTGGGGRPGIPKKKPASGGAPSGGGGGSGGTCPCMPENGALTLVVCGKLNCADASPKFEVKACGGTPGAGYSWNFTGDGVGTISGGDLEKFSLAPPENTGSGVAGTAYMELTIEAANDCVGGGPCSPLLTVGFFRNSRGCNDALISSIGANCCNTTTCVGIAGGGNCVGTFRITCGPPASISPSSIDCRTQAMIDDGCAPCKSSLVGKVVTVTDALGTSVSKTVEYV